MEPTGSSGAEAGPAAREAAIRNVQAAITAAGGVAADAAIEPVTWRRTERFTGTPATTALLGGRYDVYAAGERAGGSIKLEFFDKGRQKPLTTIRIGASAASGTLTLDTASICLVMVWPEDAARDKRVATYEIALAFVRRPRYLATPPAWESLYALGERP
jgi:hypothetical protein